MAKKEGKNKKENKITSEADAESMQANYCKLINKDFDGAMKILFEEVPDEKEKATKSSKKTQ